MGRQETLAVGARAPDVDHLAWLETYVKGRAASWQGLDILDLGCGSGYLCSELGRQGARHVVGIDLLAPDQPAAGWTFLTVDLDGPSWAKDVPRSGRGYFDLICAFDIIEHLSSPVHFLAACRDLLSSSGQLMLTTPNTSSWERLLRPGRWSGASDPQHKVLFNRYSLAFLLERSGFQLEVLRAPVRSLAARGIPCPQIGAQILAVARPTS